MPCLPSRCCPTWWRYYVQEAEFFDCTTALEDGEVVNLGPHEFEVLHTPGHAADGLVLYHRKAGLLISSDTLWGHDMAVLTVRVEGSRALFSMLESLDRLEGLEVRTVCPGHGKIFSDFGSAVSRAQKRVRKFLGDPAALGRDLIKKILVFTLMMKGAVEESVLFPFLMTTPWFIETVDLYFNWDYQVIYQNVMEELNQKGVVVLSGGCWRTTVKP